MNFSTFASNHDIVAGGLLCRASLLSTRAEGGHPIHLRHAQNLLAEALQLAPRCVSLRLFAAQTAIGIADFSEAHTLLSSLRDTQLAEVIARLCFLKELSGDIEGARMLAMHLRAKRENALAESIFTRLKEEPALYQAASPALLSYVRQSISDEVHVQLAFFRAAENMEILQALIEAALPEVPPVKLEFSALVGFFKQRTIRGNLVRLGIYALKNAEKHPARALAQTLANDPIEDRARLGAAFLCISGEAQDAATRLFANKQISMDARAWSLAFAPSAAAPYLKEMAAAMQTEDVRFLRGAPALFSQLGEQGAEELCKLLNQPEAHKAHETMGCLLATQTETARVWLQETLLSSGNLQRRRDGYEELGRSGAYDWYEIAEDAAFAEPNPEVREEALLAALCLSKQDPSAAKLLFEDRATHDDDSSIRRLAASVLEGKRVIRQKGSHRG